jgi:hypothetical protein
MARLEEINVEARALQIYFQRASFAMGLQPQQQQPQQQQRLLIRVIHTVCLIVFTISQIAVQKAW